MNSPNLILVKRAKSRPIPYPLLLLADENVEAIDKYIYQCIIYLVKYKNISIGLIAVQEIDLRTIEIKNLAISPEFRNKGLGSWCLQKLATVYPVKDQLVATGDGSFSAIRFYQKNGFRKHTLRKDFFLKNYPAPIIENGIQLKDQLVLKKTWR